MASPFIGEIKIVSFNFPPKGWAFCNGQLMPINQNPALFSLLGTTYGGNGQTNFALPDLRGRVPISLSGTFNQGFLGGEESHTLIISEMPFHNHVAVASSNAADQGSPAGNFWAVESTNAYTASPDSVMGPGALANVGGSQPHENRSPYLVLNFCIALVGVFPSRN